MKLDMQGLVKSFGEKRVLDGITLSAESGKPLGLLGRNGAGKTTTIRIVMDVFPPDEGTVLLDGKRFDRSKVRVGYLPEERGLYPKRLILDQLAYLANLRGVPVSQAKSEAKSWLERMELSAYGDKKVDTLSKGNQQKIQLAVAMLGDPDIIILDEPFSGLDPVNAQLLKDIVKEAIDKGKIVFFSSHQMSYVEEFCEDIAILNQGKIVLNANIKAHKRTYDRRHILVDLPAQAFDSAIEFAQGKVEQIYAKEGKLHMHVRETQDVLPLLSAMTLSGLHVEGYRVFEPTLSDIFVEYTGSAV